MILAASQQFYPRATDSQQIRLRGYQMPKKSASGRFAVGDSPGMNDPQLAGRSKTI